MPLPGALNEIAQSGEITAENVLLIRRAIYGDVLSVSAEQAEWLFELDENCQKSCIEWCDLFCEALEDYLLKQVDPVGCMTDQRCDWLVNRISEDGIVKSDTELEVLVHLLEKALQVPERLEIFALDQVKSAVIHGTGPTRAGGSFEPGVICEADVTLLRRILYAAAGAGSTSINRMEAEVLFDISDATSESNNCSAWADLFVKAMANYLMTISGYAGPDRRQALEPARYEKELQKPGSLASLLANNLRGIVHLYKSTAHSGNDSAEKIAISEAEAQWLATRIIRDGTINENEKALLMFLQEELVEVHPRLRWLMEHAA